MIIEGENEADLSGDEEGGAKQDWWRPWRLHCSVTKIEDELR
jgi:hypothetical protein